MANIRHAGLLLFVGATLLLFLVSLAEFLYPDYSVSQNFISDLGVGPMPSSAIFAAGLVVFGLMGILAAELIRRATPKTKIWALIGLSGIGAIGVAAFNENDFQTIHGLFAVMAFGGGNLAAIVSYQMVRRPLSCLFVVLGIVGLVSLVLVGVDVDLGLGPGGMERITYYSAVLWSLGFGAILAEARR